MSADIASGSVYMGGCDTAAATIESILTTQISGIIDAAYADGKISNATCVTLKKRCQAVGANVSNLVLTLHTDLIDAAQDAGIDLPPPSDGTTEFIAVMQSMVHPFGGGR